MELRIYISYDQAVVAVMYELGISMGKRKINSKRVFADTLRGYFFLHGISCIDDHESENGHFRKLAKEIVERYFPIKARELTDAESDAHDALSEN